MDLKSVLGELGVRFAEAGTSHHVREGWVGVDCPWCRTIGKYHLGINLRHHYAVCWKCGHHSVSDVITTLTGLRYGEVKQRLAELVTTPGPITRRTPGKLKIPYGVGPLSAPHLTYLAERGITPDMAVTWGLGGIGPAPGGMAWRIFMPVYYRGEMVSWTARAISKNPALLRYRSADAADEVIPHKHVVYGADFCRNAIIVVEGPMDAIAIGPGAGATMGLSITSAQIAVVARFPLRVVCFDNEPVAQSRAKRLADTLTIYPGDTYNIRLESGKDPGDADKAEIEDIRERFLGSRSMVGL